SPEFIDFNAQNFRLAPNSPCINAGFQQNWMTNAFDLAGNPRIINTKVDMGCYEYPFFELTKLPAAFTNFMFADRVLSNHSLSLGQAGSFNTNVYLKLQPSPSAAGWLRPSSSNEVVVALGTNVVDLIYDSAGLAPGVYTGALQAIILNDGLQDYDFPATNDIPVTLQVNSLDLSVYGVTNSTASGIDADPLHFDIISAGAGTYSYTIVTNSPVNWLQLSQESGVMTNAMTQSITLTYTNSGLLSSGVYTNLLRVVSTAGGGVTQDVAIVLNVDPLRTIPAVVTQQGLQGLNALSQDLKIYNAGVGSYHYSLTPTVSWLNILPNSGAVTHPLTNSHTLNYISSGLAPGLHEGLIYLTSPDHGGVTQQVAVSLTVLSQPELAVTPLYLEQTISRGEQPTNMLFKVWNAGHDPRVRMDYTATSAVSWLKSFAPGHSTGETNNVPVRFNDVTEFLSGSYVGQVTVVGRDAGTGYAPIGSFVMTSRVEVVLNITPSAPAWIAASSGTDTEKVVVEWEPVAAQNVEYEVWRGVTRDFDERWVVRIAGGVQ
ncbi:MAG: choice-of-anchor Q domain-containing protein, partial [Kiritimatiellia bacterium]